MNKYVKITIAVAVVAGLGVAGVKKVKEARAHDANLPKAKIYPIVVSTMTPKIAPVTLTLPYLAEVANDKDVQLASRIAARIQMIKPSGSSVKKGDVVVRLDTTTIKSSLASVQEQMQAAKIALDNLEATHKRTLDLLKVQGASIEESQKEMTMIANTQAQLNALKQKEIELKNNLSYATIVSPVNGVIAKTFASQGAISVPGKPLVAISSKNGFYLMVRVPTDLPIRGVKFHGRFYAATPLNTTFHGLAEYKVYTGNVNLVSGDRVEVDVVTFNQKATLLPFDAILNKDGKSYVLVAQGNKAKAQEVHIVQSAQQGVVVSDALEGKKIVVAKPDILLKLTSGYALKVKE
ncbi:efflux RND transporter periplasmic adaptor subunit [Sulfurimonas paralvinellae]|uniref:Efflux RND transporter periplasmic adaptor subunit n=1 Tax=Sulfurimonas paralvinellae TaxID=317658 RepID=A0A7M1B7U9_9BACT|nr:efflux RND transporter periplasmic adaptor subunit [Sulfurimonas paralvinellae]QOP45819.1 efflux RND transporter periplasmic adaptor subunit [Sulfurimonas paralvinellae]